MYALNPAGPQADAHQALREARTNESSDSTRWGSLYDALFNSDVASRAEGPCARADVVRNSTRFLDCAVPLHGASHGDVSRYCTEPTAWHGTFCAELNDDREAGLRDPRQFLGRIEREHGYSLLFRNNGLHIEVHVDPTQAIGHRAPGFVCDIKLELVETTAATLQAMRHHESI